MFFRVETGGTAVETVLAVVAGSFGLLERASGIASPLAFAKIIKVCFKKLFFTQFY